MSGSVKHQAEPMCQASSGTAHPLGSRVVRTFFTSSRAHLRRARPNGPSRSRKGCAGRAQRALNERPVPRRSGEGCRDSRRRWRGSLARCLQRDSAPARAAARRAGAPYPAAARTPPSRIVDVGDPRAGRTGRLAQNAPVAAKKITATGPKRRALYGSAPPPARAPEDPF
jgi:hypothetical protein